MTVLEDGDGVSSHPPSAVGRRREPALIAWGVLGAFLIVLALLAWRLGAGHDPALTGRGASALRPARQVLVRRVYERRVVVHLPPSAPPQRASSSQQVSGASSAAVVAAPLTRTS